MSELAVCPLPLLLVVNSLLFLLSLLHSLARGYPPLIAGVFPDHCVDKQQFYSPGRYHDNATTSSAQMPFDLEAPGSARGLWLIVALLNGSWVAWSLSLVFRHESDGCLLYRHPRILSQSLLVTAAFTSDLDLAWRVLWEFKVLEVAPLLMFLQALASFYALGVAESAILKHAPDLYAANRKLDAIFLRYVMTAGLAARGMFCLLQGLVSLTLTVVCRTGMPQYWASSFALCLLAFLLFAYMLLDVTVLERFTRTTSSMYDVTSYYFVGIAQENFDAGNRNYVFVLILLFCLGIFYVFRLILTCLRNKNQPLFNTYYAQDLEVTRAVLRRSYSY